MRNIFYLYIFFFSITYCYSSFSEVAIKGGVITSAEILKTEKPKKRDDLYYDLTKLDFSHLNAKISLVDAIRFENRIGIGTPLNRVKKYLGLSRKEAVDLVVQELKSYQDKFEWPDWFNNYIPTQFIQNGLDRSNIKCNEKLFRTDLELLWTKSILTNPVPQFEKLALLWLDHFSVAFDEYDQTHSFVRHLQFVRKHSAGNFGQFLRESIKDPGIIVFLNNEQSTTQTPNENLAREFLELFSLGEGNYSENEIKNFAKKLPSHGINHVSQDFQLYKYKSSGQTLSAFGEKFSSPDEFIDLVISHPAFGEFIAKKFYKEYISLEEPTPEEMAILVSSFRQSNFDIVKLFEATISLKSFWDKNNRLTLVKSPIELVFGTARTLGVKAWKKNDIGWLTRVSKKFGQDLFNPPNIAGWPSGKEWLAGQFLEKRMTSLTKYFSGNKLFDTEKKKNVKKNIDNINQSIPNHTYQINNLEIIPRASKKWITLLLKFSGKLNNSEKNEEFTIGLDANIKKGFFHAIRLDKNTFFIPRNLSDPEQPGKFFIGEYTVKKGYFKKLYNNLEINKKLKLMSVCKYLTNKENVHKILLKKEHFYDLYQKDIKAFFENKGLDINIVKLANMCQNFEDLETFGSYELLEAYQNANNSEEMQAIDNAIKDIQSEMSKIVPTNLKKKRIKFYQAYVDDLEKFYNKTVKDQLAVETIVIEWLPDDFETREWADINVGFYGVKLNNKFWDGISIKFGTDINSRQKAEWKNLNRIEVNHGFSHPDIFSSWEGSWVSSWNGHYGWNSSFPIGPRMRKFNAKSRDEKLLMIRLLQSMQHLLDNKKASPQLMKNLYAQEWLQGRINEANRLNWNLSNGSIPNTKVYSFTSVDKSEKFKMFRCGPQRAGIGFEGNRSVDKDISVFYSESINESDFALTTLLLPEVNLSLEDKDFLSIMSFEGYQLK
tara:strand:- start:794 stop:3619 length:2826 start_codon:yes stop_codon:yes gene_type:complete